MTTGNRGSLTDEQDSFREAMVAHMPSLKAFANSLCHNRALADDLVQDVCVKAMQNIEKFEPGSNMRAWLFTILKHNYLSLLRKRKWEVEMTDKVHTRVSNDKQYAVTEDHVENSDEFYAVVPFLVYLARDQRDCIIGAYFAGLSYGELAGAVGTAVGTVKSRINRGLSALREYVESGTVEQYNLSAWATMSRGLSPRDPYLPIAKAYEALYRRLSQSDRSQLSEESEVGEDELTKQWELLIESGALDEEPDYTNLVERT